MLVNWAFNTADRGRETDLNEGAEPCWYCVLESQFCIDLFDDERRCLEQGCELLRADRSDSSSLVYFISSVFCLSSFWLSFLDYLPILSLCSPRCPHCAVLSWLGILDELDKSAHRLPEHSLRCVSDLCFVLYSDLLCFAMGLSGTIIVLQKNIR